MPAETDRTKDFYWFLRAFFVFRKKCNAYNEEKEVKSAVKQETCTAPFWMT